MITSIFFELGTGAFFGHSFCRGHRLVVNIFFVSDVASVARNLYDSARAKFLHLCCPHASVRVHPVFFGVSPLYEGYFTVPTICPESSLLISSTLTCSMGELSSFLR